MIEMNTEVRDLWMAALRSGRYRMGYRFLRTLDDRFCVFGVLTDLAVTAGLGTWTLNPPIDFFEYVPRGGTLAKDSQSCLLGPDVHRWAGLPRQVDGTGSNFGPMSLAVLNDHERLSLVELADYIEANSMGV
jgi:hypothetical protein